MTEEYMKNYVPKLLTLIIIAFFFLLFVSAPEAAPGPGDGTLLKRAPGEICEGCHRTNKNTPSPGEAGYDSSTWNNAIKMHSGELAGTCSDTTYKTKRACESNAGTWSFGKWNAVGGWGVTGGQYGKFECTTCHTAHSIVNIFLIKETITAPSGSFPGGAVDFRTAVDGTPANPGPQTIGIMGDDSTTHSTSSFVCEVCHTYSLSNSGVKYHAYNMSTTTPHQNAKNCTTSACHSHKLGFRIDVAAACGDCHGAPPTSASTTRGAGGLVTNDPVVPYGITGRTSSGAHIAHRDKVTGTDCSFCHYGGMTSYAQGSGNPASDYDHNLAIGFYFFGTAQNGSYLAPAFSNGYTLTADTGSGTTVGSGASQTCSSIYCHSDVQGANGVGSPALYATGNWDIPASGQCGTCHKADGVQGNATIMDSGSHTKHVSATEYNMPCSNCHEGAGAGDLSHVNNIINVNFAAAYGGSYSGGSTPGNHAPGGGYGSCSSNNCHSKGTATYQSPVEAPIWGSATTGACGDCHGANAAIPPASTAHAKHVGSAGAYKFSCKKCHSVTVDNTASDSTNPPGIANKTIHLDNIREVDLNTADSLVGASATDNGSGTCSSVYCHSIGNTAVPGGQLPGGAPAIYTTPFWGDGAYGCNACHGRTTTNGRPDYTSGSAGSASANSHLKHADSAQAQISCDKCHYDTTTSGTSIRTDLTPMRHVNGTVQDVTYASGFGGSYTGGSKTCGTVYCHSDVQGSTGSGIPGNYASPQWGAAGPLSCGSCHLNMATDTTGSGSHKKHANNTTGYNMSCSVCHGAGYSPSTVIYPQHANKTINLDMTGTASGTNYDTKGNSFAPGSAVYSSCSTSYCHSQGTATYEAPNQAPTWGNTTTGECGDCHGADYLTPPSTNSHDKHVADTAVYKFSCQKCHNVTVDGTATDSTTKPGIASKTIHVNNIRDVDLRTTDTLVGASATDNDAGTCSSVYCHSTGKAADVPTAQLPGAYSGSHYSNVTWGDALTCTSCHGKTQTAGTYKGYPDYTMADQNLDKGTAKANSHLSTTHNQTSCSVCHTNTTGDGLTIASNTHVNAAINVNFDAGHNLGGAQYNPDRSCSNVSCHGATSPVWGGIADCTTCHEAGAVNISGVHYKHWETTAGNASARTTGNASTQSYYQFQCGTCHTGGTHPTGSQGVNYAEVGFNITWATGYETNGAYTTNYNGNDTTDTRGQKISTDGQCNNIYCHSSGIAPGAANPTYVSNVAWNSTAPDCSFCHGAPPASNAHVKHATTYSMGCTECHQGTVSNNTTIADKSKHANFINDVAWKTGGYNIDGSNYETGGADTCSNIYCHSQGKANSNPYNNGGNTPLTTPDWKVSLGTECIGCHSGDASAGGGAQFMNSNKHAAHVSNSTVIGVNFTCDKCHSATVSTGTNRTIGTPANHVNKQVNVTFTALNPSPAAYDGTSTPGDAVGNCNSLYCHSNGKLGTGVYAYSNRAWNGAGIDCSGCHGTGNSKGYPDYGSGAAGSNTSNSHVKHANASEANYNCGACHYSVTTDGTAINGASPGLHIDTDTQNVNFAATYGGTFVPGGGTPRSCSTVYCHSDVQGSTGSGSPGNYTTPQWGTTGPLSCASCHLNMATDATGTGSHKLHASTTGNAQYSCSVCHGTGYSVSAVVYPGHANKTINLSMTGNAAGTTYTKGTSITPGSAVYSSCSASNCHGSGSPTWGSNTGTTTCEKCHGSAATAALGSFKDTAGRIDADGTGGSKAGAHVTHLSSTPNFSNDIACNECHNTPSGVNDINHIDSVVPAEVPLTGTLAATNPRSVAGTPAYTTGSCSNVYCHDSRRFKNGYPGGTNWAPSWNDINYLTGVAATDCARCHGYPPGPGHTTSTTCHSCHPHVNGTEDGFTDPSQHVDGIVQATGGDSCDSCHSGASLQGQHALHTDATTFLSGKTVSGGDYGNASWWYATSYINGVRKFSCGYCHPSTNASHTSGTLGSPPSGVALSFAYNDPNAATTVKEKNALTQSYTQSSGSVTCSSVYCHSNGYTTSAQPAHDYAYQTTPNWYGGTFAGDRCDACHSNSPNRTGGKTGSSAHGMHVVGIHYKDIYNGASAQIAEAGAVGSGAGHGDPNTSTTINCNLCHNGTVTVNYNDLNRNVTTNPGCNTNGCHGTGGTAKGTMIVSTTSTSHVNGTPDVELANVTMKIRAQMRNDITLLDELNENWTRTVAYKATTTTGNDTAKKALNAGTYTSATQICSNVACHNQDVSGTRTIKWTDTLPTNANLCYNCHKRLTQ